MKYTYRPVEPVEFKYASFVYKIVSVTDYEMKYYTIENPKKIHNHSIKPQATFPYKLLKVDEIYTIICVRFKYTWHMLLAWPLAGITVIENVELAKYLKEEHNEHFPVH